MENKYLYGLLALVILLGAFTWATSVRSPSATITPVVSQSAQSISDSQAAAAVQPHTISWNTASFPSTSVSITLIRKVGTSPASYQVVRTIVASAANNGSATWTPAAGELDGTTYIQIGCVSSTSACQATLNLAN
jgi:hypothetical protein